MTDYTASSYGDRIAARYDEIHAERADTDAAVDTLAGLAGRGRTLELGIGTGRIALPLAARGIEVQGLDASEAMVAKLRAKPGGRDIPVSIVDFADFSLTRSSNWCSLPSTPSSRFRARRTNSDASALWPGIWS